VAITLPSPAHATELRERVTALVDRKPIPKEQERQLEIRIREMLHEVAEAIIDLMFEPEAEAMHKIELMLHPITINYRDRISGNIMTGDTTYLNPPFSNVDDRLLKGLLLGVSDILIEQPVTERRKLLSRLFNRVKFESLDSQPLRAENRWTEELSLMDDDMRHSLSCRCIVALGNLMFWGDSGYSGRSNAAEGFQQVAGLGERKIFFKNDQSPRTESHE